MIVKDENYKSFDFNIVDRLFSKNHPIIDSIGSEYRTQNDSTPYYWDCYSPDNRSRLMYIFQYTVSGEGVLQTESRKYRLRENSIFMIERPGPYIYSLPPNSDHWEFKFITLTGDVKELWDSITDSFGNVFNLAKALSIMKLWDKIYHATLDGSITNVYDLSLCAYTFLIKLNKCLSEYGVQSNNNEMIHQCIQYIDANFTKDISVLDVANSCALSPLSLNKVFKEVTGETPLYYINKQRIKHSLRLLQNEDLSIDTIARECGFENANYFAKVFKKYVDIQPTAFRKKAKTQIII